MRLHSLQAKTYLVFGFNRMSTANEIDKNAIRMTTKTPKMEEEVCNGSLVEASLEFPLVWFPSESGWMEGAFVVVSLSVEGTPGATPGATVVEVLDGLGVGGVLFGRLECGKASHTRSVSNRISTEHPSSSG